MNARRDDDALSWDGDDDPTLDVGVDAPRTSRVEPAMDAAPTAPRVSGPREATDPGGTGGVGHSGDDPEGDGGEGDGREGDGREGDGRDEDEPGDLGNIALVALGLIAGAYIFFAIGWFIAGQRLQAVSGLLVDPVMYAAGSWAATLAGPIWFLTAFVLTRGSRSWVRFAALIAGLVLVVPWPFLQTGSIV